MPENLKSISANGIRFAYYEEGMGPLILLLHGFPDTPHTWLEIQPQLAAAGFRVIAPFMRGYAPSTHPSDGNYSTRQLGMDALALIEAFGQKDAIIIGHDWGAFAAYAAANLNPARVRKLVTLAIPHPGALGPRTLLKARHFIMFQFRKWAIAGLKRNDFAEIEKIYRRWSPTWNFTKTDLEPVKRVFEEPRGIENALGYYWSFVRDAFSASGVETRRVLSAKTSVPTLSFFGELDGAIDQSAIESTRAWFTDHYKIVRVPNVGHFLHREAPQTFLNRTLEFIR